MDVHQLEEVATSGCRCGHEAASHAPTDVPCYGPTQEKSVLHLGCGTQAREGCLNVDCAQLPGVDAVWDLNTYPWPFATGAWQHVIAYHVIEHLDDIVAAVRELHRILAPGGRAEVRVPHMAGWGAWNNPTHRHFLTRRSLECFKRSHHYSYSFDFAFSDVQCRSVFALGRGASLNGLMNPVVNTWLYDWWLWKFVPCAEVRTIFVK